MNPNSKGSPLDDVEFLARSEHRVTALVAMAEQPRSKDELRALTDASPSTVGRMLREFEARHWITREGHRYGATQLGTVVAARIQDLIDELETERRLRAVWQWLPPASDGFAIEMLSDAVITTATADSPYGPVNRFRTLLEGTERFRFVGFDVALLEPCKDELRRRITGGMHAVIIDPPSVARYILSTYRDHCAEPLQSGNLTVLLHEDLPPYGISIFDDRIAISGYNSDNGTVQTLIDTDAPDAREWAESTFESFRREARPLEVETAA